MPLVRLLLALLSVAAGPCLAQGELGINYYGFSYHFEKEQAERRGIDNEVNPGLGLRYRFDVGEQADWFFDGGIYHDGGRNTAVYAGLGGFWKPTERVRLGAALAVFHSDTYNGGDAFIAPVPVAAYEWRAVTLNVFYAPKISGINEINTLGFWLTLWPKAF